MTSGLKTSVNFSHAAEVQVLTFTCNVPDPAATDTAAGRHRRRRPSRQRRGHAATAAREEPALSLPPAAVAAVATAGSTLPALPPPPPAPPSPLSPETQPPSAKKTRRCRNELELLRESEDENELTLSPLSLSGPATLPSATQHVTTPPNTPSNPLDQPPSMPPPP